MRVTSPAVAPTADLRRVSITAADPDTGEVMVRDTNGAEFSILGTTRTKGSGFPAPGEIWIIQRTGPAWTLRTQIGAPAPPVISGEIPAGSALAATVAGLAALGLIRDETSAGPGGGGGGTDEATVNALIAAALNAVPTPVDGPDAANKAYVDAMAGEGDSAYEVAVANGFVGTEAAWLASLHGEDGEDGTFAPVGEIAPEGPAVGDLWVDTASEVPIPTVGDAAPPDPEPGELWVDTGAALAVPIVSDTPPVDPTVGTLWVDTSTTP